MSIKFNNDINANGLTVVGARSSVANGEMVVHEQLTGLATEAYVDSAVAGSSNLVDSAVSIATSNVDISTLAAGDTVGGFVTSTGDRVVLNAQTVKTENGVYDIPVTGPASRSSDADSTAELHDLMIFVTSGDSADTLWAQTADNPTVGTTNISFSQLSSSGSYTGGDGIDVTGLDISVNVDDVGIEIAGDQLSIKSEGVFANNLAADSVTGVKILDGEVGESKLAAAVDADTFLLNGYSIGAGGVAVASSDKVLGAIEKLAGDVQVTAPTLAGVAYGATNLGTFTGTTITDNSTIKVALQELETDLEAVTDTTLDTYTVALSVTGSGGTQTVTHSLATDNVIIQYLDGTEFATPSQIQTDKVDTNSFQITNDASTALSGQVTVIAA